MSNNHLTEEAFQPVRDYISSLIHEQIWDLIRDDPYFIIDQRTYITKIKDSLKKNIWNQ